MRRALGGERVRLLQQLVIEAMLIGSLAGVLGALLAAGGFGVLLRSLPLGELAQTARLDWTLFWAADAHGPVGGCCHRRGLGHGALARQRHPGHDADDPHGRRVGA